ncbi:hypothetical protein ILYODFUR_028953, partial [Ilyodon furcidens]
MTIYLPIITICFGKNSSSQTGSILEAIAAGLVWHPVAPSGGGRTISSCYCHKLSCCLSDSKDRPHEKQNRVKLLICVPQNRQNATRLLSTLGHHERSRFYFRVS